MCKQKFLKKHPMLTDADEIKSICRPLEEFDIPYFSHAHIDADKNLSVMVNYPEFAKYYFEKDYYHFDLHMLNTCKQEQHILWDLIERKAESHQLHEDFKAHGRGHTFSFVFKNGDELDCYHFAANAGNISINQTYMQNIDNLKRFISYYNDAISRNKSLKAAYNLKLPLLNKAGEYKTKIPLLDYSSNNHFQQLTEHNRVFFNGSDIYLTTTESACLHWLSKGKTLEETALILDIKLTTVKTHIQKAKDKFSCRSLFQLGMLYKSLPNQDS